MPWKVLLLSAAYFFFILSSYYMLRPIRETMAIERGADKLPWLMTATLFAMLLANPAYAFLVSRFPRRKFVPITHYFFGLNIILFFVARELLPQSTHLWLGYAFYVWVSVFNLFIISIFWSVMADRFGRDRAKRIFGMIAVGGTLGTIAGAWITKCVIGGVTIGETPLIPKLSFVWVLPLSVIPLLLGSACVSRLLRESADSEAAPEPSSDALAGFKLIASSRYLQMLAFYMLLFTITSTFIYNEQATMIDHAFPSREARANAFANIDLYTNLLTLGMQLLATRQIIATIGVGGTISILPILSFAGFGALAAFPTVPVLYTYQVVRRGMHYAVDRPAREILYTPLSPDEKYKSKAFIDTFVYRAGDMLGGWAPTWLVNIGVWLKLATPIPTWVLWLPLSLLWIATAIVLGLMQKHAGQTGKAPGQDRRN